MLYKLLYFAHLTTLALWLGALVAVGWWIRVALTAEIEAHRAWALRVAHQTAFWVINPAAAIVAIAGILMIIEGGMLGKSKPLWLAIMESGGGMVALTSIVLVTWLGRRVRRTTAVTGGNQAMTIEAKRYLGGLSFIAIGILAVILIVSLRLS